MGVNTIQNFAFPTSVTTSTSSVGTTVTHLHGQNYNICIRRASGYCYICYAYTVKTTLSSSAQNSFGLSVSQDDNKNESGTDSKCTGDYIEIFGGESSSNAAIVTPAALGISYNSGRNCGRLLSYKNLDTTETITLCSKRKPFRVGVRFDEDEVCTEAKAESCEWDMGSKHAPGGITGFKLTYWQTA